MHSMTLRYVICAVALLCHCMADSIIVGKGEASTEDIAAVSSSPSHIRGATIHKEGAGDELREENLRLGKEPHDNLEQVMPSSNGSVLRRMRNIFRPHQTTEQQNAGEDSDSQQQKLFAESRIVGGEEVRKYEYPYLVSLHQRLFNGTLAYRCGGVIVAKNAVLTAAHCARRSNVVWAGVHDRTNFEVDTAEQFEVIGKFLHPLFNEFTLVYDFAVLVLNGETSFDPVQVNTDTTIPEDGTPLNVLGWGYINDKEASDVPREAVVRSISNQRCGSMYKPGMITPQMLCARANNRDACRGDSGGPLIRKRSKELGPDILVGIVSWGFGCANPLYPGVYSRITSVASWYQDITSALAKRG